MNSYDVIKKPIITEKTTKLVESRKYTFSVAREATKEDVKKAVEELFKVHVLDVNMINTLPKKKRVGRYTGLTSALQKAIITLADGDKIDLYTK